MCPLVVLVAGMTAAIGCGHSGSGPTSPTPTGTSGINVPAGTLVFKASPIDLDQIRFMTPLGNLNPPAHAIPTDHIYFYFADPNARETPEARRTEFRAPADGVVTTVLGGVGQETKVFVRQTSTFQYYIDHLIPSAALARGMTLTAGQVLGTTGSAYGIDLGVINDTLMLPFVAPTRYIGDTLHADAPLKYYEEPLRSQLYSRVQRLGPEKDGRIAYDIAGRLSGNWFVGGQTAAAAFAYDTYDPARVVISVAAGGLQGVFGISAGEPEPRDVSPATGRVTYTLSRTITGPLPPIAGAGYMLVQMTDDTHIKLEVFGPGTRPADFTSAAGTYTR